MIKIGYFQFYPNLKQIKQNSDKIVNTLKHIDADLIVLPELPFTGYYLQNRGKAQELAEDPKNSPTVDTLINLCKKRNFYIVTGFAEKSHSLIYNSALLIGADGVLHTYRKLHLFDDEKQWFDPGDAPPQVVEILGVKIGIMICFDWIFPEVMRSLAIMGADIICHPSNLILDYCQSAMLTRCLENGVFAITTNRFGVENKSGGEIQFTGNSQIVAPKGMLLHRAPSQLDELYITEIDVEDARDKYITPSNHLLEDRRPEFYSGLLTPEILSDQ